MSDIEWTKDVQIRCRNEKGWEDFIALFVNKDHVYGHTVKGGVELALMWPFKEWRFRNKPVEPESVEVIIKLWRAELSGSVCADAYLTGTTMTVSSVRGNHRHSLGRLLSVVQVNVPVGHGLGGDE